MLDDLKNRISHVEERIRLACARSGRERSEVNTIAVTKYVSLETTSQVLRLGLEHIGENRWQDAREKWEELGSQGTWHFIGHLQTNKVKNVIDKFTYFHSMDRLSLATELQRKAEVLDIAVKCFIQLNVSGEQSKFGLDPQELFQFAKEIKHMDRLQVAGLMTMAPHVVDPEQTRPVFRKLREWKDRLNEEMILDSTLQHLSMGMSNDFEIAIEEGATWVRLGSVLTGHE